MMSSATGGSIRLPAESFSRFSCGIVHSPSSEMSAHRMVMTFARRCAVSRATRTKAPNVPLASAAFQTRAHLVVGKDALAHLFLRVLAAHPLDDRRLVIVVPCRKPVHDRADNRQHGIRLPCAVIVLDIVEQGGDIAAPDREERSAFPEMEDVQLQQPGDLLLGPQALGWTCRFSQSRATASKDSTGASNAGCPARMRARAVCACLRASSMLSVSAAPMVAHSCFLVTGLRAMTANVLVPLGWTRT